MGFEKNLGGSMGRIIPYHQRDLLRSQTEGGLYRLGHCVARVQQKDWQHKLQATICAKRVPENVDCRSSISLRWL